MLTRRSSPTSTKVKPKRPKSRLCKLKGVGEGDDMKTPNRVSKASLQERH